MTVFFGQPTQLLIGERAAQVEMTGEKLQLWFDVDAAIPDRVTQSMWVSLCREALTHGNELMVSTDGENSAQVISIRLSPAPR